MGLFHRDSRGPAWKQGWTERTLGSLSAPPLPLLAIFGIIILLMTVSSYIKYRLQMQYTMLNLKLFLLILPLVVIFAAQLVWSFRLGFTRRGLDDMASNVPWSMVALVIVLLVLVSYQSQIQSMWTPSFQTTEKTLSFL